MTHGTIHLVTKDRRTGDILWDAVWCPACVAEHKALFAGNRGVEIRERAWEGDARACDSCEDSKLAPELRA